MNHEFEDIEVKVNSIQLLRDALSSKRKRCMIATGSMTDPYIPLEQSENKVRQSLELIADNGFGFTVITKSDLILRDLDLLSEINRKAKCVVQMTLTTFDDSLCRIIEPGVCVTSRRVEVLKILHNAGIETVVWLCPVLPFINDTKENIGGILNYCVEANVKGIICFGMGMTLREGNREYYYQKLDEYFPGLKNKYISTYADSYQLLSPNHPELMKMFYSQCRKNSIMCNNDEIFRFLSEFESRELGEQISFF